MTFTDSQMRAIGHAERISAVLSLLGELFILLTFVSSKKFRRPANRLILYASFGNIFGTVASFIEHEGLKSLEGGKRLSSPLCSFQAFLEQTFFPADALFCLCMAINVYLTVIHKWTASQLRKLEPFYVLGSYLLPFTGAISIAFIHDSRRGPVYGNGAIWCWIRPQWNELRIGTFYGPAWIVIFATFILYALTGKVIFRMRRSLRQFDDGRKTPSMASHDGAGERGNPVPRGPSPTEIQMTTVTQVEVSSPRVSVMPPQAARVPTNDYCCTITAGERKSPFDIYKEAYYDDSSSAEVDIESLDEKRVPTPIGQQLEPVTTSDLSPQARTKALAAARAKNLSSLKANAAAWAYARCAMLFFVGLLVTWVPSTANRLYPWITGKNSFVLGFMAACVLPGQGFWNGLVYIVTSWSSCRSLWKDDIVGYIRRKRGPISDKAEN